MAEKDAFFGPEEVDKQIEQVRQFKKGDRRDVEAMSFLRSYYRTDAQSEQETLDRMWSRITDAAFYEQNTQASEKEFSMYTPNMSSGLGTPGSFHQARPRRTRLIRRLEIMAAVILLVVLVGSLTLVLYAVRHTPGGPASSTVTANTVPLQVTSVSMSVTPASIAGLACGTNATVTYTALFHVNPNNAGGTVHFTYTVNNGRGQAPASITFNPGETTKAYSFTWSGALPADHTYPGQGGIQVTSPNQLTSPLVAPTGQCASAGFQVTNVTVAVSPSSIQGMLCGTSVVVTYTATIHVAANGPGGTVHFSYTVNNGRSQTPATITFNPGQTVRTFTFTWSGALPADHTYPGEGGIQVTSPNQLTSPLVAPAGRCG